MKATNLLWLLPLLLFSCREEEVTPDYLPPLAGWQFAQAAFDVSTDTLLRIPVLLTTPVAEPFTIPVSVEGTAVAGRDYELPDGPTITFGPDEAEGYLPLRLLGNPDENRIDADLQLCLPTDDPCLRIRPPYDLFRLTYRLTQTVDLSIWAPGGSFPRIYGYTSSGPGPVPDGGGPSAGAHTPFSYPSRVCANTIDLLGSPPERSAGNLFNLRRIYADQELTSSAVTSGLRLPKAFVFTPDAVGAATGTVTVPPSTLTLRRRSSSMLPDSFRISLSGQGRYDETTGRIELDIVFDETAIGGPPDTLRRYLYLPEPR